MRRHYLLSSVALLAFSGLVVWAWRHFDPEPAPAAAPKSTLAAIDCPAAPAPAIVVQPDLEARVALSAKPLNAAPSGVPALPPGFVPSVEGRVIKNPEFRRATHDKTRVMLEDDFRDLPKILGLSPEQAERLFDLLAEQQVRTLDIRWLKPEPGKTVSDAYQEARARNAAELTEFLGASNMIRYQEFRSTLPGRMEVNSVRTELARGPEPMRESQFDPLLAVVNVELQRLNQEISDLGPRGVPGSDPAGETRRVELTVAANQRILDASRPILSSTQYAGLEELYRRQRMQMESEDTLNRLRTEAAAGVAQTFTPK